MRWCFDLGTHAYADEILHQFESETARAFVPMLWRYEVSAVLARAQNGGMLSAQEVANLLDDLGNLDISADLESSDYSLTDYTGSLSPMG